MRERARRQRLHAEIHQQAVGAAAAGALPQFVEAQQVLRRIRVRAVADLVQRIDERLELVLELGEHRRQRALGAPGRRLRERAVGAAAHRDVVVHVHGAARMSGEESRDEERDVAEALQQPVAQALVVRFGRLGQQAARAA